MSITFWCPDAPTRTLPCRACVLLEKRGTECNRCETISEGPSANFSNENGEALLKALGLSLRPGGVIYPKDIPQLLQRLLVLLNSEDNRKHLMRAPISRPARISSPYGCEYLGMGTGDTQVVRRLKEIREILIYASENAHTVHWH
jgi:hypothetical protein